jgi:hypothetical protein
MEMGKARKTLEVEAGRKTKNHIQCFKCKQYGHYANRCPGEKKGKEAVAHYALVEMEMEPALGLMLAVAKEKGKPESVRPPQTCQSVWLCVVDLTEEKVVPELHLIGGGEFTGCN